MARQLAWIGLGNMVYTSSKRRLIHTPTNCDVGPCRFEITSLERSRTDPNQGMCKNLVEKGSHEKPLIIFNRTQQRAELLSSQLPLGKSRVASTIEEAVADSDIIFTCVGDDAAINETIDTALKGEVKGKLFIDCSTVHPNTTNDLAEKVKAKGAEFVASPVFGTLRPFY